MIAKCTSISHGGNLVNYLLREAKDARVVFTNGLIGEDPTQIWQQMKRDQMDVQLKNGAFSVVISPSVEESRNFTMEDWQNLALDFLQKFDEKYNGMEMPAGKKKDKNGNPVLDKDGNPVCHMRKLYSNLCGSQILCVLHTDSKTPHLQMAVNRVDRSGKINSDSRVGKRAVSIINDIAKERSLVQANAVGEGNRNKMEADIRQTLAEMERFNFDEMVKSLKKKGYDTIVKKDSKGKVVGWSLSMNNGQTIYKASEIGRKYSASRLQKTWQGVRQSYLKDIEEQKIKAEAEEVKKYKFVLTPDNMRRFENHISGYAIHGNFIDPGGREHKCAMPKGVPSALANGSISKADAVLLTMPEKFGARPRSLENVIASNGRLLASGGSGVSNRENEVGKHGFDESLWYLLSDDMKQAVSKGAQIGY